MIEPRPYRSWVEISRGRLRANFESVARAVGANVDVMPVVKADAYRHGAVEVSRVLEGAGARWLAVSNTDEGIALRTAGIEARILVMADGLPFTVAQAVENELTLVVHSLQQLSLLEAAAQAAGRSVPYHVKIDTGMNRLGVRDSPETIAAAVRAAPHTRLEGLMTHFASSADYESAQTEEQIEHFQITISALRDHGIEAPFVHLASSIAVAYGRFGALSSSGSTRIIVRPGHAIYGYISSPRGANLEPAIDVQPALSWRASVLATKNIDAGDVVGYGAMFRAERPMRIAVLAAGYADGIPHRLGNRGIVLAQGLPAPIIGAVSMDLTTIDITAQPDLQPGDAITLIGTDGARNVDAQDIARAAGTISYSVLCGIHARVKRIYLD